MPKSVAKPRVSELWKSLFPEDGAMPIEASLGSQAAQLHALVMVSIVRAGKEIERRLDNFVRPFDLTGPRMAVLLQLAFRQPLTPSELGERLFVTRGNMTGLVEGLVGDGLVRRVQRPGDRRTHDLELTKKGRDFVDRYIPHHIEALARLNAGLTKEEAIQLAGLLRKFNAGMEPLKPAE